MESNFKENNTGAVSVDETKEKKDKKDLLKQKLKEKIGDFESINPLSIGQQALWFIYKLAPESSAYNIMSAARIDLNVDIDKLKNTFDFLAQRHPGLRSTYLELKGKPYQVVHKLGEIPFDVIETADKSDDEIKLEIEKYSDMPINIENNVMRIVIFKREQQGHVLLLVCHHIAFDFWSLDILIKEAYLHYSLEPSEIGEAIAPLKGRFSDFVRRQKVMLEGEQGQNHLDYWKEKLRGELPILNLHTDKPRPPVQTFAGDLVSFEVEPELYNRLNSFAATQGVTLFTVVLAAFKVLLYRYTGQDDLIVATPVLGRNNYEWEDVIGYFSNIVPIRSNFKPGYKVEEFITDLRQSIDGALEHQDYPFPTLVEQLGVKRDSSRSPISQVLLSWDKGKWHEFQGRETGMRFEVMTFGQRGAPFDLNAVVVEMEESLSVILSYNIDLFDKSSVEQMAKHFHILLSEMVKKPGLTISELPLLSEQENRKLLSEWNQSKTPHDIDTCVHQIIAQQAQRTPDAIALVFENTQLTYRELNRRANKLARHLVSLGVSKNKLVAVLLQRSDNMVVALLAVLKAGGAYIPVDPDFPRERIEYMLQDAAPELVLTGKDQLDLPAFGETKTFCFDSDWAQIEKEDDHDLEDNSAAEDLAYIIYTSGSTGRPKGVEIAHRSLTNFLLDMKTHFEPGDILVAVTTLSFDIAGLEIFGPLVAGAQTVVAPKTVTTDGTALAKLLEDSAATTMQATPASWKLLIDAGWKGSSKFKALCGGEALTQELANQLLDRCGSLWNLYGPTETTIWSTKFQVQKMNKTLVPIGRPIANTNVYVLDEFFRPVPQGVPGELYIGGAGVSKGYHNQPELTSERFIPNPFSGSGNSKIYKTGDLVRYLSYGNLEFLGRLDNQVKVNGFRIELAEIEKQLCEHEKVSDAVVGTDENENGIKRLVAYVVSENHNGGDTNISTQELRSFLGQTLPAYMLPAVYVFLPVFPLTPNGKINRKALPKPENIRPELEQEYVPPKRELETLLCGIWAKTLNVGKVGIYDNFFDLGGASLQSMEIVWKLKDAGYNIKPEMLFQYQSVAELAWAIKNVDSNGEAVDLLATEIIGDLKSFEDPVENKDVIKTRGVSKIESLALYLPPTAVSTKDVMAGCTHRTRFPLQRMTGIKNRRRTKEGEGSCFELSYRAAGECLERSSYLPEHIDLLVCCSVSRFAEKDSVAYEPSTAQRVKAALGCKNAIAFDISNACAGMFTGVVIAETMIKTGAIRTALVISGEYITPISDAAQLAVKNFLDPTIACLTVGDAGSAALLDKANDPGVGFQQLEVFTDSKYSRLCIGKITNDIDGSMPLMYNDPIKQTLVAERNGVMHSGRIMKRGDWKPEDIDHFIMHQTSETSIRDVMGALNKLFGKKILNDENVVKNLAERGNTSSTTHFVALSDIIEEGRVKNKEKLVFGISGSGQNTGTALYVLDDLPERMRKEKPVHKRSSLEVKANYNINRRVSIKAASSIGTGHQYPSDVVEMAKGAIKTCLEQGKKDALDIELLIYTGVYRHDYIAEPAIAAFLGEDLNITSDIEDGGEKRVFMFDITNGSTGFLNACYVASRMIDAGRYPSALVATAEIENNGVVEGFELRGIEESAGCVLLEPETDGHKGFGDFYFEQSPDTIEALVSQTRRTKPGGTRPDGKYYLKTERDPQLHEYFLKAIASAVENLLKNAKLKKDDINIVLAPQLGETFQRDLSERLGIPGQKIVDTGHRGGEFLSCDLPYTLDYVLQNNMVKSKNIGLFISVGSGIEVACAVYYF